MIPKDRMAAKLATCPECHQPVRDDDAPGATYLLCLACGAIGRRDGRIVRLLRTEEWIGLMVDPGALDLFEERDKVLEHLTRPSPA